MHVILTGGISQVPWIVELRGVEAVDTDLTLKGLAILAQEAHMTAWTGETDRPPASGDRARGGP